MCAWTAPLSSRNPDGTGALKKTARNPSGVPEERVHATKIHLVAAYARGALIHKLSPGQAGDDPHGRDLLQAGGRSRQAPPLPDGLRAYQGDDTLQLARNSILGYTPVVPPNPHLRLEPCPEYDRTLFRISSPTKRPIERLFRAGLKAIAAFSAGSTNWMFCSPDSLSWRSSSRHCVCVNRP